MRKVHFETGRLLVRRKSVDSIKMDASSATAGPLFCVETDIFVAGAECPTSRRAPAPRRLLNN